MFLFNVRDLVKLFVQFSGLVLCHMRLIILLTLNLLQLFEQLIPLNIYFLNFLLQLMISVSFIGQVIL